MAGALSSALCAAQRVKTGPPAKSGACISPERAYCRQASQEALNTLSFASLAPPPASGVLPITCCIFWVLYIIPLRSMLEAKAFLLSPALLGVVISLKHTKQRRPYLPAQPAHKTLYTR